MLTVLTLIVIGALVGTVKKINLQVHGYKANKVH